MLAESNPVAQREANVRRLRELYLHAEDGDRPRAALLWAWRSRTS
jgi:hypothetical protein